MGNGLRKHAKWSASSASRWMKCYGSPKIVEAAPNSGTRYSVEGDHAHELLAACLQNRCFDATFGAAMYGYSGSVDDVQDAIDGVQVALDYVLGLLEAYEDAVLYVEQAFSFPSNVDPDNAWGTCDIAVYVPSLGLLYIIDYKHGAGVVVEVEDNAQLLYYATGFVAMHNLWTAVDLVNLVVIQPRAIHTRGGTREWATTPARLSAFIGEVDYAILECQKDNAPLVVDLKRQCRFCPAKINCPAVEAQAVQAVKSTFRTVQDVAREGLPEPTTLPLDRIAYILQVAPLWDDWIKAVEGVAYAHMMKGGAIPGKKLVEAQARRYWYDEDKNMQNVAAALMRLLETDDWDKVYPRKLITITEAEKLVTAAFKEKKPRGRKKEAAEEATIALAALTLKESSGKLVMVDISDSRPEANRAQQLVRQVVLPAPAQHSTAQHSQA